MKSGLRSRDGDGVVVEGRGRARTLLVLAGTGGAVFVALATLHCGPFTAVASLVQRTPLYPLVKPAVALPLVFGFVAVSAGGLALGFTRHRRLYPLLLLLGGVCLVAYTWWTALETALWFTLAFSGLAALLLAAALEFWLGRAGGPCDPVLPTSTAETLARSSFPRGGSAPCPCRGRPADRVASELLAQGGEKAVAERIVTDARPEAILRT